MNIANVRTAIDSVVRSGTANKTVVQSLFGVTLKETQRNDNWVFYNASGRDLVSKIDFRQSRTGDAWLLAIDTALDKAPRRSDMDLTSYEPLQSIDANPRIPPEGTVTYVYFRNGLRLSFSFTSQTQRLYDIVLRRDLPAQNKQ